jgi:hypothetical protein
MTVAPPGPAGIAERLGALDWDRIEVDLGCRGVAEAPPLLTPEECREIASLYEDEGRFRARVDMARHRFGVGEYKYFRDPLPEIVERLREDAYPHLAAVANRWNGALGLDERFPATLAEFLSHCAAHGQTRPTPLLLRYEAGGYNCLHQDLYGDVVFPIQLLGFLDAPGVDYGGGEFLVVEQRPRAQSAAEVVRGAQGGLVFFTTRTRPAKGTRGYHRINVRHGVSRVRWGTRRTLGVIFHDAR